MTETVDKANLILDAPAEGAWNMAVDQALLLTAETTAEVTLRFYRWKTATLSLGYFQKLADRQQHAESAHCPVVRRASGGGAILHDHELTFSLTLPSKNRWSRKNNDLYQSVHGCIVESLRALGVDAGLFKTSTGGPKTSPQLNPFLCFHRRTDGDIILNGQKIGGSAQRRAKNAILQHTSLLLRKSPAAAELPGIEDLAGVSINESGLIKDLVERLSKLLLVGFKVTELTFEQKEIGEKICEETFGNSEWVGKK